MTELTPHDPPAETPDPEADVPATDPAHRAALLVMVASPVVLGAAVYLVLRFLSG